MYVGVEDQAEASPGTPAMRCCYKLERSLGPTIVSKDKKRYAVFNTFDTKRDSYRQAHLERGKRSREFLKGQFECVAEAIEKNVMTYNEIPRVIRGDKAGMQEI